jgi:hypothetical protein
VSIHAPSRRRECIAALAAGLSRERQFRHIRISVWRFARNMVRRPPSPNSETAFESGVRIVQLYGTGNSLRRLSSAEQLTARATTHESMVTERRTAARREIRGECEHEVRTPRQGRFTATVLSTLWTPAIQESGVALVNMRRTSLIDFRTFVLRTASPREGALCG